MIIGIGGVSRAGKSTLSELLKKALIEDGYSINIIHQDQYPNDESLLSAINDKLDWEQPGSLNWVSMDEAIIDSNKEYDITIVEGLFCHWDSERLYDFSVFIEISKQTFVRRKAEDLRWGKEVEPAWYIEHIWQSYLKYGRPLLSKDFCCLNGNRLFDIAWIVNRIKLGLS